jgi:hypothetical protein
MARNFRICGHAALVSLTFTLTLPAAVLPLAPLFAEHEVLQVTLEAPFKKLMDERSDEDHVAGTFVYLDADGSSKPLAVKLRTRGHYRRDRVHCDFAPIRLNFRKTEVAGTLFDGQDKLKLVTQCMPAAAGYAKVVPREYLAYRLFQELTEISYGVRLLEIMSDPAQPPDGTPNRTMQRQNAAAMEYSAIWPARFRRSFVSHATDSATQVCTR